MLSIAAVSDADYYLRTGSGCGAGDAPSAAEYYLSSPGEPPGRWYFVHRNDLGVSGEIHADAPSGQAFRTVLNALRHPKTGEQLGRAPQTFRSAEEKVAAYRRKHPEATEEDVAAYRIEAERHHAQARHGWDMTFSVVKSISVWHAALQHDAVTREEEARQAEEAGDMAGARAAREASETAAAQAEEITAAFQAGIDAAMRMAADEFGVTRRGAAGPDIDGTTAMRHVRESNLQAAIFLHHTSRERDPQLHAHVMVLNRILCQDEQWRALFASGLLKSKHQLDAVFTRVMEAELTRRLGARFAMRPDGKAREVIGVSPEVRDLFSARSRALSEKADQMLRDYAAEHKIDNIEDISGLVRWRITQKATAESRRAKPKTPPSRAAEVARWDAEIAKEFHEGFTGVLDEIAVAGREPAGCPDFDPDTVIAQALEHLSTTKGNEFNRSQLMFAIDRFLPDMPALSGQQIVALLVELTDKAEADREVVSMAAPAPVKPPTSLIDPMTGESVFEPPRGGRFTTRTHLAREDRLVDWLSARGAPVLSPAKATEAVAGRGLSVEQTDVAIKIFTQDWFLALVEAGAGTGKSRLMAAISDASNQVWGQGLTGFTASQNAAKVLAREGVHRAHNIAAYLTYRRRVREGTATAMEDARFAVPAGATVVIDEASMVSTPQAVALIDELIEVGVGRVVMIGDTAQVDAVDAGGGFALLTSKRAPHTLRTVRRFRHEWERRASAALRDGDLAALSDYDKRGRIRGGGEPEEVEAAAVQAFVDDHLLGLESVLVVGAGDKAAQLSSQIRAHLVAAGKVSELGLELHDHTKAGVGDLIQTRLNDRRYDVVNREVWRVEAVDMAGGQLTVARSERDDAGRQVWGAVRVLPADYVAAHVELAYASTVQAVQGRTTDTGHLLIDDTMGRSRAYPGLTRGRERNTMWVPVERPPRRHRESDEDYEARIPSALSKAVAAFEREDHTAAARTIIAAEQDRSTNLGRLGPEWQQLIYEHRARDHRKLLREIVGTDAPVLFADEAVEGVLHLMRSAESQGYDVAAVLRRAYGTVRLEGARTPGGLLYGLLDRELSRERTTPTLAPMRAETYAERTPTGPQAEISYAREVGGVMDARVAELGEAAEVAPPAWASALLGGVPADIVERGVWREKVGVVAGYREQYGWRNEIDPIGPAPSKAEPERRWAWLRASRALGEQERETETASDAALANRVLEWRRAQETMPRNVDEDLREAEQAAAYARGQIVAAQNRGEDASSWKRLHREQETRIARLNQIDEGRKAAVELTTPARTRAQEAVKEISRRVERDYAVAERRAAEAAKAARERDAADARDAAVHEAVGARWRESWVPDAPVFGSQRWVELEDDAPAKRAGLFTAALQWWRMGNPRDEQELTGRLERLGVDAAPERALPTRALERIRGGEDEVTARAAEPSGEVEVLARVYGATREALRGEAPPFGTPEYAAAQDEVKTRAETRAALAWHAAGDTLDERARRAEVEEERAAAADMAAQVKAEREQRVDHRTHQQLAAARGEQVPEPEPDPEPVAKPEPAARPDVSWVARAERAAEKSTEPEKAPEPEKPEPEKAPEPEKVVPEKAPVPDKVPERVAERDDLHEQVSRAAAAVERAREHAEARAAAREDAERDAEAARHTPEPPVREDPEVAQR